jgi:DNA-binding MarR family transcriptional regulator
MLSRTNLRAQDLLARAFAAEGLRGYHFRLLAALDQHGPSSQADLARHTGIDRSDVVAALNELVEGGLARREPDPVDGRRNVVTVTRRGRSTLERLDVAVDGVQEALLAPLSPSERATFVRLLAKLV